MISTRRAETVSLRSPARPGRSTKLALCAAVVLVGIVCAGHSSAQELYRYLDESGQWVYTDKVPVSVPFLERLEFESSDERANVVLHRRMAGGTVALVAENTYFSAVQMAYQISRVRNLADTVPLRGNRVLPPRSETELVRLVPENPGVGISFQHQFQFIPGEPGAQHEPEGSYRLPFAIASRYRVSQAYPSTITHDDLSSHHAIDFVMPIGTGIFAARKGTVIQTASDYYRSGQDPETDAGRANLVRVLHDDGTMALYAHLNWNSIRVRPGQRVERGEYIADSGNTGFSTGPHLHFVVQRNVGGAIESIPVVFEGPAGAPIEVKSGDFVTAH